MGPPLSECKVGLGPCWAQKRHPRSKAHSGQSDSGVAAARSGPASTLPAPWPGSAPTASLASPGACPRATACGDLRQGAQPRARRSAQPRGLWQTGTCSE